VEHGAIRVKHGALSVERGVIRERCGTQVSSTEQSVTGAGAESGARSDPREAGSVKARNAEQSEESAGRRGIERGAI
jgi:hypothetical protein